jgi:hypothetical protein
MQMSNSKHNFAYKIGELVRLKSFFRERGSDGFAVDVIGLILQRRTSSSITVGGGERSVYNILWVYVDGQVIKSGGYHDEILCKFHETL